MRKISTLGLSVAVLAATGWLATASAQQAPAPDTSAPAAAAPDSSAPAASDTAAPAKPKGIHRGHAMHGKMKPTTKGDAAVEDLNAKSLDAAKAGTAFTPSAASDAKKAPATKSGKMSKPMHHHHKMAPKPAADAAPAPDATPAPDAGK